MDAPGDPADPDGGVSPPAAFFGLWPKFAEQDRLEEGRLPLQQPHEVRLRGLPAGVWAR